MGRLRKKTGNQDAVQDELNRDCSKDKAHQAAGDLKSDHAEYPGAAGYESEDQKCQG